MENLSVSPSRFDDVGIILNGNNCFVGLETPDGVEACTLDKPFVLNKKVLSRYDEACNYIKKILPVKMKIELPRGYRLTLTPDDLAVFFSQKCDMSAMRDYIEEHGKRGPRPKRGAGLPSARGTPCPSAEPKPRHRTSFLTAIPE